MKQKKAFITGIAGQDGSYLAEFLIENGYEVHGMVRRNSTPENQECRIDHLDGIVHTHYGDLLDIHSIQNILREVQPDEVYNLGAQSHVRISFEVPSFTVQTNALGVLNMLESVRTICPEAKFYQASSSEMFGNNIDDDGFQREATAMDPTSPYGCAKLFAYKLVRHYRKAYDMFAVNGILFNHESPRRGANFVTNKVVKAAVRIHYGLQGELELGFMDAFRDWGHSKDYVQAMHMIMQHSEPDDFVVSTMVTHSVRELCEYVFESLGLDYQLFVVQNDRLLRPHELKMLKGDSTKIRETLGWIPEYTFETLMDDMIDHWLEVYK